MKLLRAGAAILVAAIALGAAATGAGAEETTPRRAPICVGLDDAVVLFICTPT